MGNLLDLGHSHESMQSASLLLKGIEQVAPALARLFADVAAASGDGAGITRDAFGTKETEAGEIIARHARDLGLEAEFDQIGSLNITPAGELRADPEVLVASHIDSVPRGGNFDGLAGVVAGIGLLAALHRTGVRPHGKIRAVGFRGEESPWFGTAYLGSRLFTGQLDRAEADSLRRFDTRRTLADHLTALGVDLARLGQPSVPLQKLKAYLELHIEQAPLLESLNCPVAVATAIRGNIRYPFARCAGDYAHSGAVPRHLRRDALIASAKLVAFADARWRELIAAGNEDLVFTCGIFGTDPVEHAMTKVPGEVRFSLNIGGTKDDVMQDLHDRITAEAAVLAKEHNVTFELGARVGTPAVELDTRLIETIEASAQYAEIPLRRMPTVGHDAAVFARAGVPTAVILVRNANGSHNPDERMEMVDFVCGLKVLATTVMQLR